MKRLDAGDWVAAGWCQFFSLAFAHQVSGYIGGMQSLCILLIVPVVVTLIILNPVGAIRNARIRRKISQQICPTCGYDVRESPDRCPECGALVEGEPRN